MNADPVGLRAADPSDEPPSSGDLYAGKTVSRYVLERRLGRGGFGEVWLARSLAHPGTKVALKFALDAQYVRFLQHEGVLQHALDHRGVVSTVETRTDHDPPFCALEYVEGQSLRDLLRERGRLSVRDAESLMFQLLEILEAVHARGVVHRDLKPENVLIERATGRVKLTDFGLGQVQGRYISELLLSPGLVSGSAAALAGTIAYMAPEAREPGAPIDARADLYAVGIMLFECVTGRLPGGLERPSDLVRGVPRRIDRAFELCWAREPSRRAASAADLRDAMLVTRSDRALAAAAIAAVLMLPAGLLGFLAYAHSARGSAAEAAPASVAVAPSPAASARPAVAVSAEGSSPQVMGDATESPADALRRLGEELEARGDDVLALACYRAALSQRMDHDLLARTEALDARLTSARATGRLATEAVLLKRQFERLRGGATPGVPLAYAVQVGLEALSAHRGALAEAEDAALRDQQDELLGLLADDAQDLCDEADDHIRARRFWEAQQRIALVEVLDVDGGATRRAKTLRLELDSARLAEAQEREQARLVGEARRLEADGRPTEALAVLDQALALAGSPEAADLRSRLLARRAAEASAGAMERASAVTVGGRAPRAAPRTPTVPEGEEPADVLRTGADIEVQSRTGYRRRSASGSESYLVLGSVVAADALESVVIAVSFHDDRGRVIEVGTIRVPRLEAGRPHRFHYELFSTASVDRVFEHVITVSGRDLRGVVRKGGTRYDDGGL